MSEDSREHNPFLPGYQRLEAWQFADDLAVDVYRLSRDLPSDARDLSRQIFRAAVSAPANIAEGYGRASDKEFQQFLVVAHASLYEVGYFLHFLKRIELLTEGKYAHVAGDCQRTSRVLYGLMRSIRAGATSGNKHRRYLKDESGVYSTNGNDY